MTPAAQLLAAGPDLDIDLPEPEAKPSAHASAALDLIYEAEQRINLAALDFNPEPLADARKLLEVAEAELRRYRK